MYLSNLLIPEKYLRNFDSINNLSEISFDLGTYNFPHYIGWFKKVGGEDCLNIIDLKLKMGKVMLFSEESRKEIVSELRRVIGGLKEKIEFRLSDLPENEQVVLKRWSGYGKPPIYSQKNPLLLNHIKHYKSLLKLFEQERICWYRY